MDKKQQIEKIIGLLKDVKKQPSTHFLSTEPTVEIFLSGFNAVLGVLGFFDDFELPLEHAMLTHGWAGTPGKTIYQMKARGLTDDDITQDVITSHITAWQTLYEQLCKTGWQSDASHQCIGKKETIEKMAGAFEHVKKRPGMYMYQTFPAIQVFYSGFLLGTSMLKIYSEPIRDPITVKALETHGLEYTACPFAPLEDHGLNDDEFTQAVLDVHITTWELRLQAIS